LLHGACNPIWGQAFVLHPEKIFMFRALIPAALLILPLGVAQAQEATPAAAAAQSPAPVVREGQTTPGKPPQRMRNVTLTGSDPCPKPVGDEVVVCSRLEEPYRLPKAFRPQPVPPKNESWVRRTEAMDDVGRRAAGLPDTCSSVGTGGATGCTQMMLNQWSAEKRAQKSADYDAEAGERSGN
jgi:hypothetical protein